MTNQKSKKIFKLGAIEGTRTPTPLRVHGPEPCASANSATSARTLCPARTAGLAAISSVTKGSIHVKLGQLNLRFRRYNRIRNPYFPHHIKVKLVHTAKDLPLYD